MCLRRFILFTVGIRRILYLSPGAVSRDLEPDRSVSGCGIEHWQEIEKQKTTGASFESPGTVVWSRQPRVEAAWTPGHQHHCIYITHHMVTWRHTGPVINGDRGPLHRGFVIKLIVKLSKYDIYQVYEISKSIILDLKYLNISVIYSHNHQHTLPTKNGGNWNLIPKYQNYFLIVVEFGDKSGYNH